jgi:hypothetical protein
VVPFAACPVTSPFRQLIESSRQRLLALLHHDALALIVAQLELDSRDGFGSLLVGCRYITR